MKPLQFIKALAAVTVLALSAGAAQAAASYCAPGVDNIAGLSTADMTYNNGTTMATDCYGIVAGNDNNGINGLGLTWGTDWSFLLKDDNPGTTPNGAGSFMGLDFTLSTGAGVTGNWTLTGVDTNGSLPLNLPTNLDFVGVLKGATSYALYFFDDVVFNGANGGTWTMNILTPNGRNIADLSHLSLYIREGACVGDCDTNQNEVPEPGLLALLGLGLFGIAAFRRKKAV